jgi:DNA-binding CsgD family transcriptional regulator
MLPTFSASCRGPAGSVRQLASPTLGSSLLPCDVWSRLRDSLRLSDRELQIVQGIFEDQKQESIAFSLGISPHSVNTYIQRIYSKLRIGSRPQLIVRVMSEYLAFVAQSVDS